METDIHSIPTPAEAREQGRDESRAQIERYRSALHDLMIHMGDNAFESRGMRDARKRAEELIK